MVELVKAGHDVAWWNRSPATLEPFQRIGGVEYEGVQGEGVVRPNLITHEIDAVIPGAAAVVCTLPTFSHAPVAVALARAGLGSTVPVVLNPGHTGGALEFRHAFRSVLGVDPCVVECSTLTYVARKHAPQKVTTTGRAKRVRVAAMPGAEAALAIAQALFPGLEVQSDVLATSLSNVNMVLHAPGAVLGATWVEAKGGDFTFYVEGMTPGVGRVMRALDDERRAVARAFGHELPDLIEEMQRIGTVEATVQDTSDFPAAIAGGEANRRIKAPGSLEHRYYKEDFGHGLLPFLELAAIAGEPVPTASALFELAQRLTGNDYRLHGRTASAMGIAGLDRRALVRLVRGQSE